MVQVPKNDVLRVDSGFRLPEREQSAQNLATIAGLGGATGMALLSTFAVFSLSTRDPGLAWMVIGTLATVWAGAMAALWFLAAEE
jgi:hypothetical protein